MKFKLIMCVLIAASVSGCYPAYYPAPAPRAAYVEPQVYYYPQQRYRTYAVQPGYYYPAPAYYYGRPDRDRDHDRGWHH